MYWFRSFDVPGLASYAVLTLAWALGGWLIAAHVFRLRSSERILVGLGAGFVLFLTLANLCANLMPVTPSFWLAAAAVLGAGGLAAWRSGRRPWLDLRDLRAWPQLLALLVLTVVFELIGRGFAFADDYHHLPLVSVMAAGDIPPHFYLDPVYRFAYHYGLQIWAASLIRQASLFPWSAWDLSKAFAIALAMLLGWTWLKRLTRSGWAGVLGAMGVAFATGARWLLLLYPTSLLAKLDGSVTLINTGADTAKDLVTALMRPWPIEGGGPIAFPFAYQSGVFEPLIQNLGNTGALSFLTVLLLLLLVKPGRLSRWGVAGVALIFANLALSAEHLFATLWAGMALVLLVYAWEARRRRRPLDKGLVWSWLAVLGVSGFLALAQGGVITEAARGFLDKLRGVSLPDSYNFWGFSLRWPLAVYTAQLGVLSPFNLKQLAVLLPELGAGLFLAPLASYYAWRGYKRGDWLAAGLGLSALISFILPIFVMYGEDRNITRFTGAALWTWVVLSLPLLWLIARRGRDWAKALAGLAYFVAVFGGLVSLAVQLIAIPAPQLSYYITGMDARLSQQYWQRLEPGTMVFDSTSYRAVALFGYPTESNSSMYVSLPAYDSLLASADPAAIARAGYGYVYMDEKWWGRLTPGQRGAFSQACVHLMGEQQDDNDHFRQLLDVRACK